MECKETECEETECEGTECKGTECDREMPQGGWFSWEEWDLMRKFG